MAAIQVQSSSKEGKQLYEVFLNGGNKFCISEYCSLFKTKKLKCTIPYNINAIKENIRKPPNSRVKSTHFNIYWQNSLYLLILNLIFGLFSFGFFNCCKSSSHWIHKILLLLLEFDKLFHRRYFKRSFVWYHNWSIGLRSGAFGKWSNCFSILKAAIP